MSQRTTLLLSSIVAFPNVTIKDQEYANDTVIGKIASIKAIGKDYVFLNGKLNIYLDQDVLLVQWLKARNMIVGKDSTWQPNTTLGD